MMDASLTEMCRAMRRDILEMALAAGAAGSHLGGSLSLVEIMAALFSGPLRFDKNNLADKERDSLILSKGHGSMALYSALRQINALNDDIKSFLMPGSRLLVHPVLDRRHFVDFTGGSLGQGLSFAAGRALARKNKDARFYVILGDGECNEGQVWEAAMFIAHRCLKNIAAIIDRNSLQNDGKTAEILDMGNLAEKWRAFGWLAMDVDGGDPAKLKAALLDHADREKPLAIIAHTIKGAGISFMENNPQWHHRPLGKKQYEKAMSEAR